MDLCNREMEVQQTINRPHKETESGYIVINLIIKKNPYRIRVKHSMERREKGWF